MSFRQRRWEAHVLRIINLALMSSMLVGVFALYAIKYDARQLRGSRANARARLGKA